MLYRTLSHHLIVMEGLSVPVILRAQLSGASGPPKVNRSQTKCPLLDLEVGTQQWSSSTTHDGGQQGQVQCEVGGWRPDARLRKVALAMWKVTSWVRKKP